jgi:hypothetical protein
MTVYVLTEALKMMRVVAAQACYFSRPETCLCFALVVADHTSFYPSPCPFPSYPSSISPLAPAPAPSFPDSLCPSRIPAPPRAPSLILLPQTNPEDFNVVVWLYRGLKDMTVDTQALHRLGGTEMAAMSTTDNREVLSLSLSLSRSLSRSRALSLSLMCV